MSDEPATTPYPQGHSQFGNTHWSLVVRAQGQDAEQARAALAELCQIYWYPLYAFVRRRVGRAEEAMDLTQGFFAHLLEKDALAAVDPARGKFRTFLLTCCQNFVANQRDANRAKKRGGGRPPLSLDFQSADERYRLEPADTATPEVLFQRRWAFTLLESTFALLENDYAASGQLELYRLLKACLTADLDAPGYATIAAKLEMTEGAVKKAAQRLRERYGRHLREQVAATVDGPEQVEEEIRALFATVSS